MTGEGRADVRELRHARCRPTRQAVATRPAEQWGSTVYDAWLYALQPMFAPHGTAFPDYMRSDAWAAKDLQSGLGSYTELKHDTILFAKQLVAEAGGDFSKPQPAQLGRAGPGRLRAARGRRRPAEARPRPARAAHPRGRRPPRDGDRPAALPRRRPPAPSSPDKPISAADNKRLRSIGDALSAIWWRTSERSNPDPVDPRPVGRRRRHRDLAERRSSSSAPARSRRST